MRLVFRPSLNRFIARLMCWVLLFGWMAGAANACLLQAPKAATVGHMDMPAQAQAGPHHHHHDHEADGGLHQDGQGDNTPVHPACKALCDSEQSAVAKPTTGDPAGPALLAAATTGSCLVLPAPVAVRVPRPLAGTLPAPPPIPIALLRLTI